MSTATDNATKTGKVAKGDHSTRVSITYYNPH